jgi:hypothetical protein
MVVIAKIFGTFFFEELEPFPKENTLFPQARCPSPQGTWALL